MATRTTRCFRKNEKFWQMIIDLMAMSSAGGLVGLSALGIIALLFFSVGAGQELAGYQPWSWDIFRIVAACLGPVLVFFMGRSDKDDPNDYATLLEAAIFEISISFAYGLATVIRITVSQEQLTISFARPLWWCITLVAAMIVASYAGYRSTKPL